MNENYLNNRYERQIAVKKFGEAGQQKLQLAKVLVVGAGGLGCPVLQYLAGAGVGHIGIVDDDVVALNNLHRQVLYGMDDIGFSKAEKAVKALQRLNNEIVITAINERLTTTNALQIIKAYDIVVDGTDNFATRYLINDACVLLRKPIVFGAISSFEGQVAIFNCPNANQEPVNYRDLFVTPPKNGDVLNCAEAGVLGILPGIIGTMMANETIKLISGIGEPLINKMLTYNALTNQNYEIHLSVNPNAKKGLPKSAEAFQQMDYEWLCANDKHELEINAETFNEFLLDKNVTAIDVREVHETPIITEFTHVQIPLQHLESNMALLQSETILLFCQTGKRSLQAAIRLRHLLGHSKKIYSLQQGITHWKKQP